MKLNFKYFIYFVFVLLIFRSKVYSQTYRLLPDTLVFCEGDSAYIDLKQTTDLNYSITWTTPYNIITNIKKIKALRPGKYVVKVSYPKFKSPTIDSTYVKLFTKQKSVVRDTVLCRGSAIWLEGKRSGVKYLWSTGEITSKIKVVSPGKYFALANYGSCLVTDTFNVKLSPKLEVSLPTETVFCNNNNNKVIQANASYQLELIWSNGQLGSINAIVKEGTYWLKSSYKNCAGSQTDTIKVKFKACDCEMLIPNSFTPNDDLKNDYFYPVLTCDYSYYNINITDRWGNTVFYSNNINSKWDGKFKGNLCPEDIYVYKIESMEKGSDKKLARSGHIALIR